MDMATGRLIIELFDRLDPLLTDVDVELGKTDGFCNEAAQATTEPID